MSISSIGVYKTPLYLRAPFTTSFGTYTTLDRPFVVIETREGLRGVGEVPTLRDPAYKAEVDRLSAAGIDLSNLALVAGALSLGIGFGLQNIVNNFVSGLILLAERPFKVGDWIVAGGVEGNVRKISVRATEVETFRRQTVILPNSELINAAVGNWTLRNKLGRVDIPVNVADDNDPRRVHAVLTEIIGEQPGVLKNPAPSVDFSGFSDGTLNFVIRAVVPDITGTLAFTNELRFRLVERFREEGITMPSSSRELQLKTDAPSIVAAAQPAAPVEDEASPREEKASRDAPADKKQPAPTDMEAEGA